MNTLKLTAGIFLVGITTPLFAQIGPSSKALDALKNGSKAVEKVTASLPNTISRQARTQKLVWSILQQPRSVLIRQDGQETTKAGILRDYAAKLGMDSHDMSIYTVADRLKSLGEELPLSSKISASLDDTFFEKDFSREERNTVITLLEKSVTSKLSATEMDQLRLFAVKLGIFSETGIADYTDEQLLDQLFFYEPIWSGSMEQTLTTPENKSVSTVEEKPLTPIPPAQGTSLMHFHQLAIEESNPDAMQARHIAERNGFNSLDLTLQECQQLNAIYESLKRGASNHLKEDAIIQRPISAFKEENYINNASDYHAPFNEQVTSLRVLAVNDIAEQLAPLKEAAKHNERVSLTCVTSAKEARVLLERDPTAFDVILLDYHLAGHTGTELSHWMYKVKNTTPIVAYSMMYAGSKWWFDQNIDGSFPPQATNASIVFNYLSNFIIK